MSNYTKFTLDTFKTKLKAGAYSNLTGANRALGKMKELSDADKDKARTLAAKHFGGTAAPSASKAPANKGTPAASKAPGKRAGKPAGKKAGKQAGKKTTKKVAKKAAKVDVDADPAPASPKAAAVEPSEAPDSSAADPKQLEERKNRVVEQMGSVITTIGDALKSMGTAKELCPDLELKGTVNAAMSSMSKAVQRLDTEMSSSPSTTVAEIERMHADPKYLPVLPSSVTLPDSDDEEEADADAEEQPEPEEDEADVEDAPASL